MTTLVTIRESRDGRLVMDYRFRCDRRPVNVDDRYDVDALDAAYAASEVRLPTVGSIYMVRTSEYVGPNRSWTHNPSAHWSPDNGEGWGGNSNPDIRRYHGWRGTTDDWAIHGAGVRRCLAIRRSGNRSRRIVIVFGRDLKKHIE